jgi:protein SCO1/2
MMRVPFATLALSLVALAAAPGGARADEPPGTTLSRVGFDQNLDAQLPLQLAFRDEAGRSVTLGDYFGAKPVILALVYYRCPMLCGEELKGLARSLKPLSMTAGDQFDVVVVSIDPTDTPELAAAKKEKILDFYGRPETAKGWHFLTGAEPEIAAVAKTVGFRYTYNAQSEQYVHAAGIVIATPGGKLARYFYGIDFPPKDVQFGLIESSKGKIGSPIARLLLFCYHYDPTTGKYTLAIVNILRFIGTATALGLAAYVVAMIRRDRRPGRGRVVHPAPKPTAS